MDWLKITSAKVLARTRVPFKLAPCKLDRISRCANNVGHQENQLKKIKNKQQVMGGIWEGIATLHRQSPTSHHTYKDARDRPLYCCSLKFAEGTLSIVGKSSCNNNSTTNALR